MSTISDRATVSVEINSQAAVQRLTQLSTNAKKFGDALEKALSAGDKQAIKNKHKGVERRKTRDSPTPIERGCCRVRDATVGQCALQELNNSSDGDLYCAYRALYAVFDYSWALPWAM